MPPLRKFLSVAFAFCAGASVGRAVIIIGPDDTQNKLDPGNGAPWAYVAEVGGDKGSGVYLGNGWVLTADHVSPITPVVLDNVSYSVSSSQTIVGSGLALLQIAGDPGLPALALIDPSQNDLNQPCMMIGWGLGKGTAVPDQGWLWGNDQTHFERWATNNTLSTLNSVGSIQELQTLFDITQGRNEGQITEGDSGCGLFENLGGIWVLAGIGADGTTRNDGGSAFYDNDLNTAGDQPDTGYFIEMKPYLNSIEQITGTPEPSAVALVIGGLGALGSCRWRGRSAARPLIP